jgi:hypothetical protein
MATKKQRRRRERTFRHEMPLVMEDEEGNEVEVTAAELRAKQGKPEKQKAAPAPSKTAKKQPAGRGGRVTREPPVPSWNRSIRRGALWGGVMFLVVVFFFTNMALPARIAMGLLYAAAFVPLTYWIDRMAYRNWQRRQESGKG